MTSLMCGLVPSAAACAGGCLGSLACCALKSGNTDDYRVSKLLAMLLQITAVTVILVIQSTDTSSWLAEVPGIKECGSDDGCYSLQIAYRIGFSTACVFAFHLALSLLGRCFANKVLNSFWIFKFVFVFGASGVFLLIPNSFFDVWAEVASVILGWFLVVQMVWIIDFAFGWNDLWLANAAEDRAARKSGKSWYIGLLFFSLAFLAGAYTWYGNMFKNYADERSNQTILIINIAVSSGLGLVSLFSPRGGILPASLVILYTAWLSWSTVITGDLNINDDSRLAIGMALAAVILIYASYQGDAPQVMSESKDADAPLETTPAVAADPVATVEAPPSQETMGAPSRNEKKEKSARSESTGSWKYLVLFNSMHLSAACYLMDLTLSWKNSPEGLDSLIPYWVQAAAAWTMLFLYGWTLIAPILCTCRQF